MRRTQCVAVAAALVLLLPGRALATPQDLFGLGARTPALAFTGVSYADDYEAVLANPAGLSRARHLGIHIGASAAAFDLRIDDQRAPYSALESSRGFTIGATLPIPFGDILEDRLVLGVGVFTPQQVLLRGQVIYPEIPQWPVLSRGQSLTVNVALGIDFHSSPLEGLRIGGGVTALADLIGDLDVRLDENNQFVSTVETQLLAAFAPIVGISYEREGWFVGLAYRHELRSEMDLTIRISDLVTGSFPVAIPLLTLGGLVQYDPSQLAGEISYVLDPGVRIIANLTWRMWSQWPGPYRRSSLSSNQPPAPGFSDTVSPRFAFEGTVRDTRFTLHGRGGYALELSPSPPARFAQQRDAAGSGRIDDMGEAILTPLRFVDNDRHILTAGLGVTYNFTPSQRLRLDLFGQVHILADRAHDIALSGSDPDDPGIGMRSSGAILVAGWTLALEF